MYIGGTRPVLHQRIPGLSIRAIIASFFWGWRGFAVNLPRVSTDSSGVRRLSARCDIWHLLPEDRGGSVQATDSSSAPPRNGNRLSRAGKYLVFFLGREEFGLHVLRVREIMGLQDITPVPQTPSYLKGVINLRGKVTPVVDLRSRFGFPPKEYDQRTCIIVVQITLETASTLMGIIVDGVSEVLNLSEGEIEDTPNLGASVQVPYILGMAKAKGKVKILLDIDAVLSLDELQDVESFIEV
jgi:purine-binding chemotaxis protein CheW